VKVGAAAELGTLDERKKLPGILVLFQFKVDVDKDKPVGIKMFRWQ